jgi:hypothetical protein
MVIPVIIGATGIEQRFKEKFGIHNRKAFSRFTATDSCTWNTIHNAESTAV